MEIYFRNNTQIYTDSNSVYFNLYCQFSILPRGDLSQLRGGGVEVAEGCQQLTHFNIKTFRLQNSPTFPPSTSTSGATETIPIPRNYH